MPGTTVAIVALRLLMGVVRLLVSPPMEGQLVAYVGGNSDNSPVAILPIISSIQGRRLFCEARSGRRHQG